MPLKPSPWQQDIESTFTDPEVQEAVDEFMRSRYQPRVTQLEQQLAGTRDAQNLWNRIHEDPLGTFNALRDELVAAGYPLAEATAAAQATVQDAQAAPAPQATEVASAAQEDPRVAEMYAAWTREQEMKQYDATIAEIVNDPANADINPNRYHTFVAAADGDFNRALEMYRADVAQVLADYGVDPANATAQQQEAAAQLAQANQAAAAAGGAPPVMGNGAAAPVPTQPDYAAEGISPQDALHKAIEDAAKASLGTGNPPPIS